MREDLDFARPLACDVAIAGAGLAGLVAGAILARRGRRVVVVDRAPRLGGRGGSTPHRGGWLDLGQRDAPDPGDLQVGWRYGQLAAAEAAVEVPLRPVTRRVRVHLVPEVGEGTGADGAPGRARDTDGGGATGVSPGAPARVVEGAWTGKGLAALARDALGCPAERLPAFGAALARLAGASAEERRAALPVRLDAWLEREGVDPEVRRTLLRLLAVLYAEHPERASAGRVMGFFARREDLPETIVGRPDHPQVGGMQGLALPFADALAERGGELILGMAPVQVVCEGSRAAGLLAVDESHLALEVRAPAVVLARPLPSALEILPPERVDPGLRACARALADEQAAAVAWQAGLARLPRLRSSGEPERHEGWNRVLREPGARYAGGWHVPSLSSTRQAPDGKHLLHAVVGHWLRRDERWSWPAARAALKRVRDCMAGFYADLEECVEWSGVQWVERPALVGWQWSGIPRHGARAPGLGGLYLAGSTLESDAGPVDVDAHAGLEAARAVIEDGRGTGAA